MNFSILYSGGRYYVTVYRGNELVAELTTDYTADDGAFDTVQLQDPDAPDPVLDLTPDFLDDLTDAIRNWRIDHA